MANIDDNTSTTVAPTPPTIKIDLTGRKFGRLVVLGYSHTRRKPSGGPTRYWVCKCSCGTVKAIDRSGLIAGVTLSCGCLQKERVAAVKSTQNGHSGTLTFSSWYAIMHRCTNPNNHAYEAYAGRGITVCERWHEYEKFLSDMGERPSVKHSIDRIDNNGNYEPGNCRWVLMAVQNMNRSNTLRLTFNGETKTLLEWAKITNISYSTLISRHTRGWSPMKILTRPVSRGPLKGWN